MPFTLGSLLDITSLYLTNWIFQKGSLKMCPRVGSIDEKWPKLCGKTNTGRIRLTDQMVDQIVLMQIAVQLFGRKCKDGLAAWWMEHCSN